MEQKKGLLVTVYRSMELLKCFSHDKPEWSLSDLSRRLDQPKAVVFRLLHTLREGGFVEQNPRTKKYQLGMAVFHLGAVVESQMDVREKARDPMLNLAEKTRETVILSLLDHDSSVCVAKIDSPHRVKVMAEVGQRLELYAGAPHKILLAYYSPGDVDRALPERLKAFGPNSVTDRETLLEQLALIRKRGYAVSQEERSPGIGSVSAPIRDKSSRVIASLGLAIPLSRFTPERIPSLIELVKSCGLEISKKLGYQDLSKDSKDKNL